MKKFFSSVYKNYICYEKFGGRVIIAKLTNSYGRRELTEIWFSRIYSPTNLTYLKMWEGVCTFLINNEVRIIEYESSEVTPMDIMKKKTRIKFNFPLVDSQNTQILRNDVIISFCKYRIMMLTLYNFRTYLNYKVDEKINYFCISKMYGEAKQDYYIRYFKAKDSNYLLK